MRNGEIAKKYNMPPSSISTILSMREIIKADWNKTAAGSTRKHLSATGPIEKALSLWLTQQRTLNIPVSEPILAEKARQLFSSLLLFSNRFSFVQANS